MSDPDATEFVLPEPAELTAPELAARAGVPDEEIARLAAHGVLEPRDGDRPYRTVDAIKIRFAQACEEGGIPIEALAEAIRQGRLSFAFVETWPFERDGSPTARTYGALAEEIGVPFPTLRRALEAFGFTRPEPTHLVGDDARAVASLIGRALAIGIVDEVTTIRLGHFYAESLRRIALAETEIYHARIEMPLLDAGAAQLATLEQAAQIGVSMVGLLEGAVLATYHRQQELTWAEHGVEHIEQAIEDAGVALPERPSAAMCFLDLSGYTKLTEERGDDEAAALAARLSDVVQRHARRHRGEVVKWVGDGVMIRFREPGRAVAAALDMVADMPTAGLPAAHVGIAAGPVIRQGGDYFGRTVNLASRISDVAVAGQVLVSEPVMRSSALTDVTFSSIGATALDGVKAAVELFEARRTAADGAEDLSRPSG